MYSSEEAYEKKRPETGLLFRSEKALRNRIDKKQNERKNMIFQKLSRLGARSLAAIVILGTSVVMVNSVTVLSLAVPNAVTFSYAVAGGGVGPVFALPAAAANRPMHVMGCNITVGNRGVGHVSLLRATVAPAFIMWVGQHSDPTSVTQGFTSTLGSDIVYLDFSHDVPIEVVNAGAIRIANTSAVLQQGFVTLIW
jgi:hypothetical protein